MPSLSDSRTSLSSRMRPPCGYAAAVDLTDRIVDFRGRGLGNCGPEPGVFVLTTAPYPESAKMPFYRQVRVSPKLDIEKDAQGMVDTRAPARDFGRSEGDTPICRPGQTRLRSGTRCVRHQFGSRRRHWPVVAVFIAGEPVVDLRADISMRPIRGVGNATPSSRASRRPGR